MLCEKCKKNEATVFYRENVNGKEKNYSLCQKCAEKLEKKGEISFSTTISAYSIRFSEACLPPNSEAARRFPIRKDVRFAAHPIRSLQRKERSDAPDAMTRLQRSLREPYPVSIQTRCIREKHRQDSAASSMLNAV